MEEMIIREGANLVSKLVSHEGKDKVISTGKCPICDKVITFELDIENRSWNEELAGNLYQLFLLNHEICSSCRSLCEKWLKEHRDLALKLHLTYREVGNKLLEKRGKSVRIGEKSQVEEEEVEETDEVSQPNQAKIEVANG
jgi:hypothetical protein